MRERPILFSGAMVKALLEGRKTQTRRTIKKVLPQGTLWSFSGACVSEKGSPLVHDCIIDHDYQPSALLFMAKENDLCPYGVPGDRLWVREAWKTSVILDNRSPAQMIAECKGDGWKKAWTAIEYLADGHRENWDTFPMPLGRHRNARFMPRDFSRITLEITEVRVQRLQEISEADAQAEGVTVDASLPLSLVHLHRIAFRELWDSINGADSWAANPWTWALTFKRVQP